MAWQTAGHNLLDQSSPDRSAGALPAELAALLNAADAVSRERAWEQFLEGHSRLMLHACRTLGVGYDSVMDRYAYIVEQLRSDDFRRLRSYVADGRGKFTTWLTVVVRRLCLDQHRSKYGRARSDDPVAERAEERVTRRRLVDLMAEQIDVGRLAGSGNPEADVRSNELHDALPQAMRDLEPRDRLLLTLRFEDDLAAREIGEVMGFPTPFHVYRRLNGLLGSLRTTLERHGIREAAP